MLVRAVEAAGFWVLGSAALIFGRVGFKATLPSFSPPPGKPGPARFAIEGREIPFLLTKDC